MDDLNNDLKREILLRLPLQSLLTCKRVCKSWYNIIDSSTFKKSYFDLQDDDEDDTMFLIYSHNRIFTYNGTGFIKHYCALEVKEKRHGLIGYDHELSFVGPVNGLICIYFDAQSPSPTSTALSTAVYNPYLDKIKILSPPSWTRDHRYQYFTRLIIGFGSDINNNDYKVVQMVWFPGDTRRMEVYRGTTDTWTEVPLNPDDDHLITHCHTSIKTIMPSKNGSGSWANWQIQTPADGHYQILSFNMKNEVFETISYPNFLEEGRNVYLRSLEVFVKDDDSFTLLVYTCDFTKLEVWELQSRPTAGRGGSNWTHVTDIIPSLFHPNPENMFNFRPDVSIPHTFLPKTNGDYFEYMIMWPIALWKKHGLIFNIGEGGGGYILYDYSIHKVDKVLGIKTGYPMPVSSIDISQYKASLISP